MLEIILNGEKLSRNQFNNSLSKQHYSFSRSKRFAKSKPAFETEFKYQVSYDLAQPSCLQKRLFEAKHVFKPAFNTSSPRIKKHPQPQAPSADKYDPKILSKSKSCTFGVGRDVI